MADRPLRFFERLMLADGERLPVSFKVARLAGPIDPERLAAALDGLQAAHPVLGKTLARRCGAPWLATPGAPVRLALEAAPRADASSWRVATGRALAEAPAPDGGPLLRLLVVGRPDAPAPFELVLMCPHFVADGRSSLILLRGLLALLRDPDSAIGPVAPLDPALCAASGPQAASVARRAARIAVVARPSLRLLSAVRAPVRRARPDLEANALLDGRLGGAATARLRDRARARGTNLTPVLATAWLRAFAEVRGRRALGRVRVTIEARRHLPDAHADQLFAVADSVRLARPRGAARRAFWDEAASLRAVLDRRLARLDLPARLLAGERLHGEIGRLVAIVRESARDSDVLIGHLGSVALGSVALGSVALGGGPDADGARYLGGSASMPWRNASVVTSAVAGGELVLTMMARGPVLPVSEAERVLSAALACLEDAAG